MDQAKFDARIKEGLYRGLIWAASFCLAFSIVEITHTRYFLGTMDFLAMTGFIILAYCLQKKYLGAFKASHASLLMTAILFLSACLDGGIVGAGFIWSIGFSLLACFIVGARLGLRWVVGYALTTAIFLSLTCDVTTFVHYDFDELSYGFLAYAMFAGFAYVMAISRENRETLLFQSEKELSAERNALIASESRFETLLNTLPEAVLVHTDDKVVYSNPAAVHMFGMTNTQQLLGKDLLDFVHKDSQQNVMERRAMIAKTAVGVPAYELKMVKNNGDVFDVEATSEPIIYYTDNAILVLIRDVSIQKAQHNEMEMLQLQLEHAQRLESLGRLAGGIAHDFNNLLAAIMGNNELASWEVEKDSKIQTYLKNVDQSCEIAAGLCKQMLAYAGKGELTTEQLRCDDFIQGMATLLRSAIGSNLHLKLDIQDDLPDVMIDKTQLQQVLMNFIVNASEAIGDHEGEISIVVKKVQLKQRDLQDFLHGYALDDGEYVAISVADDGCGLDADTAAKIFDPFYTTKHTGHGLGLSSVLGIMQRHKGSVKVTSELGKGSQFTIILPAISADKVHEKVISHRNVAVVGHGKVLLVDDDEPVRNIVKAMLSQLGFEVICAQDGVQGVEMFQSLPTEWVMVVMDMTMPRMGGVDAMHLMRDINAEIPIIFISGFSDVGMHQLALADQPNAFIQKPFRFKVLKNIVAENIRVK